MDVQIYKKKKLLKNVIIKKKQEVKYIGNKKEMNIFS